MKFLPKFGNQKLTLDLVINTYKYPLITMKKKYSTLPLLSSAKKL